MYVFEGCVLGGCHAWVFVTDGLSEFVEQAKKAFWRNVRRRSVHISSISARNEYNVQVSLNGQPKHAVEMTEFANICLD